VKSEGEELLKEVVLAEVVVTLVADLKKVPYFFSRFHVENMIVWSMVESKHNLKLGFLVTLGPFKVGLSIHQQCPIGPCI